MLYIKLFTIVLGHMPYEDCEYVLGRFQTTRLFWSIVFCFRTVLKANVHGQAHALADRLKTK